MLDSGAEGTGGTIPVEVDLGSRQSHDKVGSAPRVPASDSLVGTTGQAETI